MKFLKDLILTCFFIAISLVFIVLFSVLTQGCGRQDVVVSGSVSVKHELSLDSLRSYFIRQCIRENPDYTEEQLQDCADAKIADLLHSL